MNVVKYIQAFIKGPNLKNKLESISRKNLPNEIMNLIVDSLLEKLIKPGDKLPTELELATKLGVGRNSVREAIKMLSSLGLVEIKRGVGTFISTEVNNSIFNPLVINLLYSNGLQNDLTELRYFFEVSIAELMIKRYDVEEIEKLKTINEEIYFNINQTEQDIKKIRELDMEFHNTILLATKNPFFISLGSGLYKMFYATTGNETHQDTEFTYTNHKKIIDCIERKDNGLIKEIIWDSLTFWRDFISEKS